MRDFNGRRYWLVGASEGVGRALAHKLSRVGAEVIVSARNQERLVSLVQELPGHGEYHVADVSQDGALEAVASKIGRIDGMVYLSGILAPMTARKWDTATVLDMLDVNLMGAVRAVGAVMPAMLDRDDGHIVLTGSLSTYRGLAGFVGYGASKAGLNSLAESLRADLEPTGVDLQIVNPGYIKTNMTADLKGPMPLAITPEKAADYIFTHMQGDSFSRNFPLATGLAAQATQLLPDWLYFTAMGRKK